MPIRDVGYKPYEGELLPAHTRYKVLIKRTLSIAWSSGLTKTVVILGMFPMIVCGVMVFLKAKALSYLAQRAQGASSGAIVEQVGDPGAYVFYCGYWCQIWFVFSMSLLMAAPAIAEDVRTGAFQFYFSRPLSRTHYVGGKLVSVGIMILLLTAVPMVLLSLLWIGMSPTGEQAAQNLRWLLGSAIYAPIYAAAVALPPIAMSSLGRRSGNIMGLWATFFFATWILGESIATAVDVPYLVLLSIPTNLRILGQHLFGMEPAYGLPWYLPAAALGLFIAGSLVVVLRRLERVEVFA